MVVLLQRGRTGSPGRTNLPWNAESGHFVLSQVFKCLMSYLHKSKFCPACENFSDKTGLVYTSKSCVIQFQELGNMGAESEKYQVGSRKIKCNNP